MESDHGRSPYLSKIVLLSNPFLDDPSKSVNYGTNCYVKWNMRKDLVSEVIRRTGAVDPVVNDSTPFYA